jgi:predicted nucleic acid-binding protein
MRLFLDASVLLAACGSHRGASREVIRRAGETGWILLASPYVLEEVAANVATLGAAAVDEWSRLRSALAIVADVLTVDRPVVFEPAKDRPVLFTSLAWSEVLLTLDRADFGTLIGGSFYGLRILTPGMLLEEERAASQPP